MYIDDLAAQTTLHNTTTQQQRVQTTEESYSFNCHNTTSHFNYSTLLNITKLIGISFRWVNLHNAMGVVFSREHVSPRIIKSTAVMHWCPEDAMPLNTAIEGNQGLYIESYIGLTTVEKPDNKSSDHKYM
jgi:hypothetical protein